MDMTIDQRRRYSRTILLEGVGNAGQQRLLSSTVAIVGAGALGSTAAMYLAASGVGHLRIADFDTVDISNLQRQLTYTTADLGRPKVRLLAERIAALNPDIHTEIYAGLLTRDSIDTFISGADLIIEGSDNPDTKYLVTDAADAARIPCILGAVGPDTAQLLTLSAPVDDAAGSAYRRLFPKGPGVNGYLPCSMSGLLGPLPGIIATMQATAALNHLLGRTPVRDTLTIVNPLTLTTRTIPI